MRTRTWRAGDGRCDGFTLVELLAVLTIIAIAFVVAIPVISGSFPGARVAGAAREAVSALREARSAAILSNSETRFLLSISTNEYGVEGTSMHGGLDKDLELTLIAAASERVDDQTAAIRFFPDGTSTGGQLQIASEENRATVQVDWLTGRVFLRTDSNE